MLAVLVLPLAGLLIAGPAERTRQVEEMARVSSAVEKARIVELSGIEEHEGSRRRTYFTAEARVRVADDAESGGFRTTAVRTLDRPVPGDEVWVLYSPGRPELGAVSDDPDDLRKLLRGGAVPTAGLVLALVGTGLTLVLFLAIAYSGGGGFRRRIRSIDESGCAVRVRVAGGADYSGRTGAVSTGFRFGGAGSGGAGREGAGSEGTGSAASGGASEKTVPCLLLATPWGEEAPFVIESYAAAETAAAVIGPEDAWLYLKRRPESKPSDGGDTPQARLRENRADVRAVLIGDGGWLLRGLLPTPAALALLPRTQRPVTDPAYRVREIDLHRAWPALLRAPALLCAGIVLVGVAGCLVLPQTVPHLVSCGVAVVAGLAYDNAYRSYRNEEAPRPAEEPSLEPR
ncbi:hypothetical protein ACFW9F_09625 [Streptomyces sp. NPDC059506]|uniref:hypothetical protein n=1 Tax=Streptomyces sp. NPDC059506 TaxID=3347751 RepID=UPI00368C7071